MPSRPAATVAAGVARARQRQPVGEPATRPRQAASISTRQSANTCGAADRTGRPPRRRRHPGRTSAAGRRARARRRCAPTSAARARARGPARPPGRARRTRPGRTRARRARNRRTRRPRGPDGGRVGALALVPPAGAGAGHVDVGAARVVQQARVITSAIGERQMLPEQTKQMRVGVVTARSSPTTNPAAGTAPNGDHELRHRPLRQDRRSRAVGRPGPARRLRRRARCRRARCAACGT